MANVNTEDIMAGSDRGSDLVEKINLTVKLFPFVCGICYEKFNKIDTFYLHLQAHNQNTSDCFHICNNVKAKIQRTSDSKNIFKCGSCLKPFFSICTLHKHMLDVYDLGSYEFDQKTNTAFPKGELHENLVCRDEIPLDEGIVDNHLVGNAQPDSKETVNDMKTGNDLEKQDFSSKKTKRKHKNKEKDKHINEFGKETEEINANTRMCNAAKTLKRQRGRPPKTLTVTIKSKDSQNSMMKSKTGDNLLNTKRSDVRPSRNKTLKPGKSAKTEKNTENRKAKRKPGNNRKELNGVAHEAIEEKCNVSHEEIKAENIDNDLKPDIEQTIADTDEKLNVKSSDNTAKLSEGIDKKDEFVNSEMENGSINNENNSKNETIIKETMSVTSEKKVHAKKRKRKADKTKDEITATENRKVKKYFFTCNICNKTMGLSHKKRHNAIHTAAANGKKAKDEYETCDICGKSVLKSGLKVHQANHSDDRPYLCDKCPQSFKLKSNLYHHKQIHDEFKPHACDTCGKRFHRRTDLRFHLRVHSDERPAQCPQCPLRFRKTSTLNIHMKVHKGDKCHQCELCGKAFIRKDYLKRHMHWHSGMASHECHVCGKKFMEKGGLQRHVKIHSEEKSNICHICGKGFVLATNMKQHVKNVHNKEKKKSAADVTENAQETANISNQSGEATLSLPVLPEYKVMVPEEIKNQEKKEYHTLMPRVCEYEIPTINHLGQSRNYIIPQELTNVQSTFYSTMAVPTAIQIPYHDSSMMSHVSLPTRQAMEVGGGVMRQSYTDHQPAQSSQTLNIQYVTTDNTVQYTNM